MDPEKTAQENKGLSLLKAGRKGVLSIVFSRTAIIVLLLALQVLALFGVFRWFGDFLPHIFGGTVLFSVAMVLYLLNSRLDASAKLTWLLVITLLPVFGALMYLFTQSDLGHRTLRNRAADMMEQTKDLLTTPADTMERLERQAPGAASLARYLDRCGSFPVYENTAVTYFPLGEKKFTAVFS